MKKLLALACAAVAFVAIGNEWKAAIDAIVNDANLPAKEKIAVLRATAEGAGDARGEFVGAIRELAAETGDAGAWAWCDAVDAQKPALPHGQQQAVSPVAGRDAPVEDPEMKEMLKRLKQPMPTEEEMQEAIAKLPPLKPLPVPKIKIEKNAINDKLINSATPRSAVINVREKMRLFIGEMDEEDEKKFDEKWAAALDFPCKEVRDWLKGVSPLLDELVKLKAELEHSYGEYEEALAEANALRLNRLWAASHEAMRQVQCVAGYMKAIQARMDELVSAIAALGPMPDAAKLKEARVEARKAARKAVTEYFRPTVNTEIGGWYELEGKVARCDIPAPDKAKSKKGLADELTWEIFTPSNYVGHSLWAREKFYIRPLVKLGDSGVVVVYVNEGDDHPSLNADFNALETEGGGLDIYKGTAFDILPCKEGEVPRMKVTHLQRIALRPFVDEDGNSRLLVQYMSYGKSGGACHTAIYRPAGGDDLEMLPGSSKPDIVEFAKIRDDVDMVLKAKKIVEGWKDKKWTEDEKAQMVKAYGKDWLTNVEPKLAANLMKLRTDAMKEAVECFKEWFPKAPFTEMPKAKDVYYVLSGMEPIDVKKKPNPALMSKDYEWTDSHYRETVAKATDGRGASSGIEGTLQSAVQLAMFRCDVKRIGEIFYLNKETGLRLALDHATSEIHLRWAPPSTILRADDGAFTMPLWHQVAVNPFKHAKISDYVEVWGNAGRGEVFSKEYKIGPEVKETLSGRLGGGGWKGEAKPEETFEFHVGNLAGGEMGIRYRYRRMVLTEEEAAKIAQDTNGKFKDMMRKEWESQNFAEAEKAVDDYAARLSAAEQETVDRGDRIAFIKENIRWQEENMKWLKEQMDKERALAKKYVADVKSAFKDADRMQGELKQLGRKIEDERQNYWYHTLTLSPGAAGEADKRYWEAKSQRNSLEVQVQTAQEKAKKEATKANANALDAADRFSRLQFAYIAADSNLSQERDLLRAEETGVYRRTPTSFDKMCHKQLLDSAQREVERDREAKRVRDQVRGAIEKLAEQEEARKRGDLLRLAKYHDEKAALERYEQAVKHYGTMPPPNEDSIDEWRAFGRAVGQVNLGRAGNASAKAFDELAVAEENLRRAEIAKNGSTFVLCLGAIGAGTPQAAAAMHNILLTKFVAEGYIEGGVEGAALGYVRFHSVAIDFLVGGIEGYKADGFAGLALHGGISLAFHIGMPLLANSKYLKMDIKNIPKELRADAAKEFGKLKNLFRPPKAAVKAKAKTPEELEYEKYWEEGREAVSDFIQRVNDIHMLNEKTMTNEQIQKVRDALVKATARVNEHPGAKMLLKMDPAYHKVGVRFNEEVGRIYKATEGLFYKGMAKQGFSFHKIKQFRNASSKGSVGMDADIGMADETARITCNGRRVSLNDWQEAGAPTLKDAYKKACGGDLDRAWGQLTTSQVSEGYRNTDWLTKTGTQEEMRDLLNGMSLSDAEQAMDVTLYKAWEMLEKQSAKFPRLLMVREACRGTVKDMDTKFLKALDARIFDLKALKAKSGASFSKVNQRELQRLTDAREYYGGVRETLNDVANGKLRPGEYEDAILKRTGDKDLLETIADMRDFMKSLVF